MTLLFAPIAPSMYPTNIDRWNDQNWTLGSLTCTSVISRHTHQNIKDLHLFQSHWKDNLQCIF